MDGLPVGRGGLPGGPRVPERPRGGTGDPTIRDATSRLRRVGGALPAPRHWGSFCVVPVLLTAGVGLVLSCFALAHVENLVEAPRLFLSLFGVAFACYSAALWAMPRLGGRHALLIVLAVAGLSRLVWLWTPPTLSTDAYRYIWDARVGHAGISPYAAAPTAPAL